MSSKNTWDKLLQIKTGGRDDTNADEYHHPIIEDGVQLVDMVYLRKS